MMIIRTALVLLLVALAAPSSGFTLPDLARPVPPISQSQMSIPVQGCCKHCRQGKACGDSCISRNDECHVGPGCACNG